MIPTDINGWILTIISISYFTFKDFLLFKLFKGKSPRMHPIYLLIMTFIGIYVNSQLQYSYIQYLDMSYIRGSIQLPPFTLIFIAADFISSVALIAIVYIRLGMNAVQLPFVRIFMDVMRFFFLYAAFTSIVSHFWLQQLDKQINFDYNCFKNQLAIDAAVYYYRHNGEMPGKLSDFTEVTINPFNNSPLLFQKGEGVNITITDKQNNKLVDITNFIGIGIYKDHPEDFFTTKRITNKNMCKGTLKIPSAEELRLQL